MAKAYVKCSVKAKQTTFGELLKVGIKADELKRLAGQANDKGYVNLVIGARRETSEYGDTHSMWVDDFTPTRRDDSDVPF